MATTSCHKAPNVLIVMRLGRNLIGAMVREQENFKVGRLNRLTIQIALTG